jgi:hypothetical protein
MENDKEMIEKEEALRQINLALRRTTMLYHAFGATLIKELGRARGIELIKKAIEAYGTDVGLAAQETAKQKGLKLTPGNFESDLPVLAWKADEVIVDGEKRKRVHFCPVAKDLLKTQDTEVARLYCRVDQAKMQAFNPDYEFLHLKNLMDGDPFCELVIRPVEKDGN